MLFKEKPKSETEAVTYLSHRPLSVYSKVTAAETITPAQFVDAVVDQAEAQSAHDLTTPTAAAVIAALHDPKVGATFEFVVCNSTGGANVTVVGGAGVTLRGGGVVAAAASQRFVGRIADVETPAITLFRA